MHPKSKTNGSYKYKVLKLAILKGVEGAAMGTLKHELCSVLKGSAAYMAFNKLIINLN